MLLFSSEKLQEKKSPPSGFFFPPTTNNPRPIGENQAGKIFSRRSKMKRMKCIKKIISIYLFESLSKTRKDIIRNRGPLTKALFYINRRDVRGKNGVINSERVTKGMAEDYFPEKITSAKFRIESSFVRD